MIIFKNDGIIPLDAFTVFGMSAKPGSKNPIGKFGTGLKYAVSVTLRLGGSVKLFVGGTEYKFYTHDESFRGVKFSKVFMSRRHGFTSKWSKQKLPFTTELGKHWEPWMAVRELEANTRDEVNGISYTNLNDTVLMGERDKTIIIIDCPEMEVAYNDIDKIFLNTEGRKLIHATGVVNVYEGESDYLFFNGMRVTDLQRKSKYTYEVGNVELTEDRTSKNPYWDARFVQNALLDITDDDVIKSVIDLDETYYEHYFDWEHSQSAASGGVSFRWHSSLKNHTRKLQPRFKSMLDNIDKTSPDMDDEICVILELQQWIQILDSLTDSDPVKELINDQLKEEGYEHEQES